MSELVRQAHGGRRSRKSLGVVLCEHCGQPLLWHEAGKIKLAVSSRVMAFKAIDGQEDREAETNCPFCGESTAVPQIRLVIPGGEEACRGND